MPTSTTQHPVFDFTSYLADRRDQVESTLDALLPLSEPDVLWQSMRYSTLSSGKRLRALLSIAAFETVLHHQSKAISPSAMRLALALAAAIEMIHAMSLIHDDLPCLDNDDLRRGKPTNHKVFGEAMALLAGDALLMRATEVLICSWQKETTHINDGGPDSGGELVDSGIILDIIGRMSAATGAGGMVGGQVFDLEQTGGSSPSLDPDLLHKIHRGKTGALIKFSLWSGARLAGADEKQLSAFEKLGDILGLAFQIADDLLDVVGDKDRLGKTPGKDEAAKKLTWVAIFGVQGARKKLAELESEGKDLLNGSGLVSEDWPILQRLLESAIHRDR